MVFMVFSLPETLVKTLAKDLVKNLTKYLVKILSKKMFNIFMCCFPLVIEIRFHGTGGEEKPWVKRRDQGVEKRLGDFSSKFRSES